MSPWPTFLVLSPRAAGGERVATGLRALPLTCLPTQQIGFFSSEWGRGAQWYSAHFRDCGEEVVAVGEHSTSYVQPREAPVVAARIDGFLESVRLVAIVRHPMARAQEAFDTLRRAGRLDEGDAFEDLLHGDGDVHGLRTGSHFTQWLTPYRERFGRRLLVLSVEQLRRDTTQTRALMEQLQLPAELAGSFASNVDWPEDSELASSDIFDEEIQILSQDFGVDVSHGAV